jgi:hypothetical protein
MKTKEQIEKALLQIAPRASDALDRLAQTRDSERSLEAQAEFSQACSVVDVLRWVLGDGDRTDLPIGEYLMDKARMDDLIAYLDRFSRSARQ